MGWVPPEHRKIHAAAVKLRCGRRPEPPHSSHGRITGAVEGAGAAPLSDHRHPGCVLRGNGRVGAPGLSAPAWPRVVHAHFGSPRRRRRTPMSTTGSAPVRQRGRPDRRLHHRPGEPSGRMGQPRAVHVPRGHRARQGHRPRRGTADCRRRPATGHLLNRPGGFHWGAGDPCDWGPNDRTFDSGGAFAADDSCKEGGEVVLSLTIAASPGGSGGVIFITLVRLPETARVALDDGQNCSRLRRSPGGQP